MQKLVQQNRIVKFLVQISALVLLKSFNVCCLGLIDAYLKLVSFNSDVHVIPMLLEQRMLLGLG